MTIKPLPDTDSGGAGLAFLHQLEMKTEFPVQWRGWDRNRDLLRGGRRFRCLPGLLLTTKDETHSKERQNGNIPDLLPYKAANMTLESKHVAIKVR